MRKINLFICCAAVLGGTFAASIAPAETFTYHLEDHVANGASLSTDGWVGDDIANWISSAFTVWYARNNNGGDNTITRQNDANFSYSIPAGTKRVTIELNGRFGGQFFQAGLADSAGNLLVGLGGDYYNSDKCFIIVGGTRYSESGTSFSGDTLKRMKLVLDLEANGGNGSGSLYFDNNLVITNRALTLPDLTTASGLYLRDNSKYTGPSTFWITTTADTDPPQTSASYDLLARVGLNNDPAVKDFWQDVGAAADWVVAGQTGDDGHTHYYFRSQDNSNERFMRRINGAGWEFTVAPSHNHLVIEYSARGDGHWLQLGRGDGAGGVHEMIGLGFSEAYKGQIFIPNDSADGTGGTTASEGASFSSNAWDGDNEGFLRLEVDWLYNPKGTATLSMRRWYQSTYTVIHTVNDLNFDDSHVDLSTMDAIEVRAKNKYRGVGNFSIVSKKVLQGTLIYLR